MKFNLPRWAWRFFPKKVQKGLVIASIRENMLFFGYDLSTVSDEELEENMVTAAHLIARAMPTVGKQWRPVENLARAMNELNSVHLVNSTTGTKAIILPGPPDKGDHHESEDHK